jgi:hypothetical protein
MWEFVCQDLHRAVVQNGGESNMDDLFNALITGQHSLWVAWDRDALEIRGVCTTFIHDYPRKRVFFIGLLAGRDLRLLMKCLEDQMCNHAREMGCTEIASMVIPRLAALIERVNNNYITTHEVMVRKL